MTGAHGAAVWQADRDAGIGRPFLGVRGRAGEKCPVHPVSAMIGVDLGRAASWDIAGLAGAIGTGLLGKGTWGSLALGLGFELGCTGILTNGVALGLSC